jgi:hypothetical protein
MASQELSAILRTLRDEYAKTPARVKVWLLLLCARTRERERSCRCD